MANSTADGSVVIDVNMDINDAEKQLAKLKGKVHDLETDLKIKGNEKIGLQKQLEAAKKAYDEFAKAAKVNEAGQLRFATEEEQKKALEMYKKIKDIEAQIDKVNDSIEAGNAKLEATKLAYGEIEEEAKRLREQQSGGYEDESALTNMEILRKRMIELFTYFQNFIKNLPGNALDALKSGLNIVLFSLKSIAKIAPKAFAAVSGAAIGAGKAVLSIAQKLNVFSKLSSSIGHSLSRLGSMIKRVFVFSVITSGLRAIRSQISESLSKNAELSTSLARLKGSLLTAFQPIYSAVLPALNALINTLSRVIAVVAQFIAALFGTTAKQAQSNAKALNEQAKATGAAGSAAAKAEKQLASFDEINKLSGTDSGGGGGGGGGGIEENPFDIDMDNTVFKSWGEAFSAFLDSILNDGIPRLRKGLLNFADWLNDFSNKLYEMFTFPGVKEKVIQIGKNLALAFNDFVNAVDWYQLGMALGAGLNLALLLMTNFIYTFDWINLGMKLAEFVNGLVSQIDWYEFGRLLWAGFKIGIETLAGFLLGLDMSQIIAAAQRMALGFVDSINETFASIDWNALGEQLAGLFNAVLMFLFTAISTFEWENIASDLTTSLNSFVANVDWAMLGQTISEFMIGVLTFLAMAIETFDWVQLGENLKTMLVNIDYNGIFTAMFETMGAVFGGLIGFLWGLLHEAWEQVIAWWNEAAFEDGKFTIEGLLNGILESLVSIGTWIYQNVFQPFINGFKKAFGINSPSTVMEQMGKYMLDGLFNGLSGITSKISSWGSSFINGVRDFFGIHSPSTEFEGLGVYMMAGLQNGVSDHTQAVVTVFSVMFTAVTALCNKNMELMRISMAALLVYFMTQFSVEWEKGWYSCYKSTSSSIVAMMAGLDSLSQKIAATVNTSISNLKRLGAQLSAVVALTKSAGAASASVAAVNVQASGTGRMAARLAAMPALAQTDIPHLARGAVIPPNREFMAVLGDQKRGTNIETPLPLMIQAFKQAMAQSGIGGNGGSHTVILQVDRRELGRVVYEVNNEETQRIGVSFAGVNGF